MIATLDPALEALGLADPPPVSLAGLRSLFLAWCRAVPFDNLRKRAALRSGAPGPLPGGQADDLFGALGTLGTGGTCWPTANALAHLLEGCGFDARRVAGSMLDRGDRNHGSVVVRLDGTDHLVDSSMLLEQLVPLRAGEGARGDHPLHPWELEAGDDGFVVRFRSAAAPQPIPCRLLDDPVDEAFFHERHEASRVASPFNDALFARRNFEGRAVTFRGTTRYVTDADGTRAELLAPERLREALVDEMGYAPSVVDAQPEVRGETGIDPTPPPGLR